MKNTIKTIVLTLVVMILAANLSFAGDKVKFFQAKMDNLTKAILADDVNIILSFYTEDSYSLPSYQPMMIGKEEMRKMHDATHKNSAQKTEAMKFTIIDVFGSEDQMVQIGKYDLTMSMKGMDKKVEDKGKFVSVWTKTTDGSWKIKAEIWNTDLNPWAMMGGKKKEK